METQENKLPGTSVFGFSNTDNYGLAFDVRKVVAGVDTEIGPDDPPRGTVHYQASVPYRNVIWTGNTAEEALSCMLSGLCEYSRSGQFNPSAPRDPGAPPIQHALELLVERLDWDIKHRAAHLRSVRADEFNPEPDESAAKQAAISNVVKNNEIIAALATSIAALARVKDL